MADVAAGEAPRARPTRGDEAVGRVQAQGRRQVRDAGGARGRVGGRLAPGGGDGTPRGSRPRRGARGGAGGAPRRNAERGVRAICFSEMPTRLKLPSIHTGYWDPLWRVCNDTGVTVCMHVGSSSSNPAAGPDSPLAVGVTLSFNNSFASMSDWLFSGKLIEFPKLKLAYSEGQIGWIPYVLERADTLWQHPDGLRR